MTQERFLKLLDNPDLLASISYEELKTLALTYPYAHNLRYLLVIKAQQDNHADFSRNLAAAAAYSLDRTCLYRLVAPKKLMPQPVAIEATEEQVLELKPIQAVQRELHARVPLPRMEETAQVPEEQSVSVAPPASAREPAALDLSRAFEPEPVIEIPGVPDQPATIPASGELKPEKAPPVIDFRPSFGVWISQFNPPVILSNVTAAPKTAPLEKPALPPPASETADQLPGDSEEPEPEKARQPTIAQVLAEKSVTENKAILSETLARLYARQGYRDKAIAMYQRLSLAFPEKSAYFAAEIEKLKK